MDNTPKINIINLADYKEKKRRQHQNNHPSNYNPDKSNRTK